jgi:medium-chain acyl-[acyl-carrier-protein] hydrolase
MKDVLTANPWFPYHKENRQARLNLFCFPYAGGGALIYRNWSRNLPTTVAVQAVQLPGRGNRIQAEPFTNMTALVPATADALFPYLDQPFAFFGHSMGARISFELARYLRRNNGPRPEALFVSGGRAPQVPDDDPIRYNLPEPEFIEELRRLNGTPPEVLEHPELLQLMIPLLRADFSVVETYEYLTEPPLNCPIFAFGGLQDIDVTRAHIEAWREQTTGHFWMRMFEGDHFFFRTCETDLLRIIGQKLHQLGAAGI